MIYLVIVLSIFSILPQDLPPLYVNSTNIYIEVFREPVEKMIVLFVGGTKLVVTNYVEELVVFPYKEMERERLKYEDIVLVIHNHLAGAEPWFSRADISLYWWLRGQGFRGLFLIYLPDGKVLRFEGSANRRL